MFSLLHSSIELVDTMSNVCLSVNILSHIIFRLELGIYFSRSNACIKGIFGNLSIITKILTCNVTPTCHIIV